MQIVCLVASLNTLIRDESNSAELRVRFVCDTRHCSTLVFIRSAIKLVLLLDLSISCCHNNVPVFERFIGYR